RLDLDEPERERRIDTLGERDVVDRRREIGRDVVVRRIVDNRVGEFQLEPCDGELAAGGLEGLLEGPQLPDERWRGQRRRLVVGSSAARPTANAADDQGTEQDEPSLKHQLLRGRAHSPLLYGQAVQRGTAPSIPRQSAVSRRQSPWVPPVFSSSRTLSISIARSTAFTMS